MILSQCTSGEVGELKIAPTHTYTYLHTWPKLLSSQEETSSRRQPFMGALPDWLKSFKLSQTATSDDRISSAKDKTVKRGTGNTEIDLSIISLPESTSPIRTDKYKRKRFMHWHKIHERIL